MPQRSRFLILNPLRCSGRSALASSLITRVLRASSRETLGLLSEASQHASAGTTTQPRCSKHPASEAAIRAHDDRREGGEICLVKVVREHIGRQIRRFNRA